jgi:putative transcription factor
LNYCEICGNLSSEKIQVVVDGVNITVCRNCSKRGKAVPTPLARNSFQRKGTRYTSKENLGTKKNLGISDNIMLVDDYAYIIRNARIQKNLTHEQLGAILKERSSLLRRFETGSLKPDRTFATKLERYLGIRLYVPEED